MGVLIKTKEYTYRDLLSNPIDHKMIYSGADGQEYFRKVLFFREVVGKRRAFIYLQFFTASYLVKFSSVSFNFSSNAVTSD